MKIIINKIRMSSLKHSILFITLLLVLDQTLKIWIKSHMVIGEEFSVLGNWFIIHFIENNGMAFGMELDMSWGKIVLSLFRILAVSAIGWYLYKIIDKKAPPSLILSVSMIFTGALGNIIDSAFYGVIFSDSNYQVATLFPETGGYSSFLHGKVVDMFYFPLLEGNLPSWIPIWENEHFIFFRPVFNLADSYITVGVIFILFFHRKYFSREM